ncbi:IS21-like element helper ATPase IstB [Aminirod propionatiphilus]|uniref:IS21-like element helper ATPase IstB n=1 Tax=Aminirod propionatiphilus TaxID=3415223 RepID=A0ACD1DZX3_9BACT|nr:IS21-like element helper ATPase IstB [Synergistota bacterium]
MNAEIRDMAVERLCRDLRLPGVLSDYRHGGADMSPGDDLRESLEAESASRREKRLRNLLKSARLPYARSLSDYDFLRLPSLPKDKLLSLADGGFVGRGENLVLLGSSGTGKTHIAIGLAACCVAAGCSVRFTTALTLAQELLLAQDEHRLPKVLKSSDRYDLVIVDERGYLGLGPGGAPLFQFFADRYERKSVCITTNLEFGRWPEVFGDATLTEALLDRLTHHAHIFVFKGESYRFAQRSTKELNA